MTRPTTATLAASAALLVALLPAAARADARADIVDLRHGRPPTRHELLGWTPSGEAAFRWIVCSEGGERHCMAAVGAFGVGTERVTTTLDFMGDERLPVGDAIAFIRRERAAIAALGALAPAPAAVLPAVALGVAESEVRARIVRTPDLDPGGIVHLAVHAGGRRVDLGRIGTAYGLDALDVSAYPSPDSARVALAVRADTTSMCWSFTDLAFVVVDVAEARARLGGG